MNPSERERLGLDDELVADYLRRHPEFFDRYPSLLAEVFLPHESGSAVSLVERQVSLLRERNIDLRRRLAELLKAARDNDVLFAKLRHLTLAWLDADSLDTLERALAEGLCRDLGADFAACHFTHPRAVRSGTHLRYVAAADALPMRHLTGASGVSCGPLRGSELAELCGAGESCDGSAVLVAFAHGEIEGLLAIGSRDPERFTPEMGTLFVQHMGAVLSRVLERLLERQD